MLIKINKSGAQLSFDSSYSYTTLNMMTSELVALNITNNMMTSELVALPAHYQQYQDIKAGSPKQYHQHHGIRRDVRGVKPLNQVMWTP